MAPKEGEEEKDDSPRSITQAEGVESVEEGQTTKDKG
jgi:hypothetical protein